MDSVLEGYAAAAKEGLVDRFEAISSAELFRPVCDLFPRSPVRVADIGAGTGRDAAWFAAQGHSVLAVEPVDELRAAGMARHRAAKVEWLNDRLPDLTLLQGRGEFDLIVLCAVWQHLDDVQRSRAIVSLAKLTAAKGMIVMSLRHGAGASSRSVFPANPDDTISAASRLGFSLHRRVETASVQAGNRLKDVSWTWLALTMR